MYKNGHFHKNSKFDFDVNILFPSELQEAAFQLAKLEKQCQVCSLTMQRFSLFSLVKFALVEQDP